MRAGRFRVKDKWTQKIALEELEAHLERSLN